MPAGNMTAAWVAELRASGIAGDIFYPLRPDDEVDIILDSNFDVLFKGNLGSNLTKSFFTGLTLFLLEPVFWFHYDYDLTARVDVRESDETVLNIRKSTTARISAKYLSLSEIQGLEGKALGESKQSLFRQVIQELPSR